MNLSPSLQHLIVVALGLAALVTLAVTGHATTALVSTVVAVAGLGNLGVAGNSVVTALANSAPVTPPAEPKA